MIPFLTGHTRVGEVEHLFGEASKHWHFKIQYKGNIYFQYFIITTCQKNLWCVSTVRWSLKASTLCSYFSDATAKFLQAIRTVQVKGKGFYAKTPSQIPNPLDIYTYFVNRFCCKLNFASRNTEELAQDSTCIARLQLHSKSTSKRWDKPQNQAILHEGTANLSSHNCSLHPGISTNFNMLSW